MNKGNSLHHPAWHSSKSDHLNYRPLTIYSVQIS